MANGQTAAGKKAKNAKRIVLLLWVLVAFFYFYLSYDYIRASMNDRQFGEYLSYVVQLAGTDRRPTKDIRDLLMVKAEELALPIRRDQIRISGGADSLAINVAYDVDIEIPLIQRTVYTKTFEHTVKFGGVR